MSKFRQQINIYESHLTSQDIKPFGSISEQAKENAIRLLVKLCQIEKDADERLSTVACLVAIVTSDKISNVYLECSTGMGNKK